MVYLKLQKISSNYFIENFQIKENETKIRNTHPRITSSFTFLTVKVRAWVRFGLGLGLGLVLE